MKTIVAIIEKASDGGYSIYTKDVDGGFASGLAEDEARKDFLEVLEEQADFYRERAGNYPDWFLEGYTVAFHYDISGFFLAFPFFNVSKLAEAIGINPSLMRKYKEGLAFASEKQKEIIQNGLNDIIKKMSTVQF
ncbi:MAG: type II toxin-antitoxin system HicB family antitoxin [Tannerellaceae bacterium]|jgi:predicted RNase H-like HicB family nuclease|nr:type II toxin-antitoxin system HicB family antitoxin [Tannerellaceae bacterium]